MMEAKPSLLNKLLFLHWPDPQIFGPSVGPITNLNIFILKTDAVKKTPNTVVMHCFLFYCISLYTLHYDMCIKVQCIRNMYNIRTAQKRIPLHTEKYIRLSYYVSHNRSVNVQKYHTKNFSYRY